MGMRKILPTLKSYCYIRILPLFTRSEDNLPQKDGEQPIAVICDPMTLHNISQAHTSISLTPRYWKKAFENTRPKFLFCEAAWSGAWRGQIYRDRRVFYENRKYLTAILDKCRAENIATVFWAKEDPAYFEHNIYDFTDTALMFDYILTTAEECITAYRALGHKQVYLWPFGFSEDTFYPPEANQPREPAAVFAGSWYKEHSERCKDLEEIFDTVLAAGIKLRIYDRYRKTGRSAKPFPLKYQPYVQDAVAYSDLGEIYRRAEYAINVNTVCGSETMFARRVYEAMACGSLIISNESKGMRRQFGDSVWFIGNEFDFSSKEIIRNKNIEAVFKDHTRKQRMEQLYTMIGCDK